MLSSLWNIHTHTNYVDDSTLYAFDVDRNGIKKQQRFKEY